MASSPTPSDPNNTDIHSGQPSREEDSLPPNEEVLSPANEETLPPASGDRFGHLSSGRDAGPGRWRRAHPGVFSWGLIEKSPGRLDWYHADGLIQSMQKDDAGILITLWPFADWDQQSCHSGKPLYRPIFPELGASLYKPCDLSAYSSWVNATVERYDGDGIDDMPKLLYPVRHWEIANEPEMQEPPVVFFQGGPADYIELLQASTQAIRNADPSAIVILGGQAGMLDHMIRYWEPILAAATREDMFDVGNIHSISSSDTFSSAEYREFLNEHGHAAKPYWITEAEIGISPGLSRPVSELAQIPLIGSVTSFVNGAEKILIAGAAYGGPRIPVEVRESWEVVVATIGDFSKVTGLSENSALFVMPNDSVIYALWDGAKLPTEVTGQVLVRRFDGLEQTIDASLIDANIPMFVMTEESPVSTKQPLPPGNLNTPLRKEESSRSSN